MCANVSTRLHVHPPCSPGIKLLSDRYLLLTPACFPSLQCHSRLREHKLTSIQMSRADDSSDKQQTRFIKKKKTTQHFFVTVKRLPRKHSKCGHAFFLSSCRGSAILSGGDRGGEEGSELLQRLPRHFAQTLELSMESFEICFVVPRRDFNRDREELTPASAAFRRGNIFVD